MNPFFLILFALAFTGCSDKLNGVTTDAGAADAATPPDDAPSGGGTQCSSARDQLFVPINRVSTGAVSIVSDVGGTKTIYIDAAAGGAGPAKTNPRVYLDLGSGTRVDVTDKSAPASKDWDLALKRVIIFTNSGDGGAGTGGAVQVAKAFGSVTPADVHAATPAAESFFDADCNAKLDPTQAPLTTFSSWYDYDEKTNIPSPKPNVTYVVRGGTGRMYKVGIKSYDALPDGGSRNNVSTGFYLLEVTEVTAQ